jgi:hypothetical protein
VHNYTPKSQDFFRAAAGARILEAESLAEGLLREEWNGVSGLFFGAGG